MSLWRRLSGGAGASPPLLRCSFCNKSQRDVRMLIAGPSSYICDECVNICVGIVAKKSDQLPSDPAAVPCLACGNATALRDTVRVGTRGALCNHCMALVREALSSEPAEVEKI